MSDRETKMTLCSELNEKMTSLYLLGGGVYFRSRDQDYHTIHRTNNGGVESDVWNIGCGCIDKMSNSQEVLVHSTAKISLGFGE